jgi:hypothetical protein
MKIFQQLGVKVFKRGNKQNYKYFSFIKKKAA